MMAQEISQNLINNNMPSGAKKNRESTELESCQMGKLLFFLFLLLLLL